MTRISDLDRLCRIRKLCFPLLGRAAAAEFSEGYGIYDALKDLEDRAKTYPERLAARRIATCLVYMLEHLDTPVRVPELCRIADLSKSHFFALFKRATGDTPINFVTRARTHRACAMLSETNMTVKEIAASLGYRDVFYFSRTFKLFHGLSPSHYRTQKLKMETVCVPSLCASA